MESTTLRNNGPDDGTATIQIPVRPEYVAHARTAVEQVARRAELPPDRVDDLVVAVSEACTNAIEAQLRARVTDPIELSCSAFAGTFEVSICDRGDGFEPGALPTRPPLADPGHLAIERGWGIQLMRALVDEVVFDLTDQGTCVLLRVALDR